MKAYIKFTELYLRHILITLNNLQHPDGKRWYVNYDHYVQPLIDDAILLKKELDGESTTEEEVKACWGRAHDRGFI
jgi:hypothetical protein